LGDPAHIPLGGKDVMLAIFWQGHMPDMLFFKNDTKAIGAMQIGQSMELSVPNDRSIIGFDGLSLDGCATKQPSLIRSGRASGGSGETPPFTDTDFGPIQALK
jgi:DNA-binding LacI/PurR family transcriptional regulator